MPTGGLHAAKKGACIVGREDDRQEAIRRSLRQHTALSRSVLIKAGAQVLRLSLQLSSVATTQAQRSNADSQHAKQGKCPFAQRGDGSGVLSRRRDHDDGCCLEGGADGAID